MTQIKLVLVDIDGTLLNDQKQITPKTRDAINKLRNHGIRFGMATGRSPYAILNLVDEWGLREATDIVVGFNGSCFMDMHTQAITETFILEGKGITELLNDFKDFDFNAGVYDRCTFHCLKDDRIARETVNLMNFDLVIDDLSSYQQTGANKVLVTAEKEEMDRIVAHYETLSPKHYAAFLSGPIRLECINPKLSKSKGIQIMIDHLGLNKDQIMTFGDMMNDYEMIRDYVGVAMGNADDRVKEVAAYITGSNNDDGIATALESLNLI